MGSISRGVESIRKNIDFYSQINRFAIKGENLAKFGYPEGSMKIESSISVAKVLVFAKTKIKFAVLGIRP